MKQNNQGYASKFWKEWLEADLLKREDLIKKLPIVKNIWDIKKLPKKIREHSFALLLLGFFEDLESAVYTKIELEENKRKDFNFIKKFKSDSTMTEEDAIRLGRELKKKMAARRKYK